MGGGHSHRPVAAAHSGAAGRLAPQAKVLATLLFIVAAVSTRRESLWAFVVLGGLVALAAMLVDLALLSLLRRLVIEVPFVAFAFLLPIIGRGERIRVLGLHLSRAGLWGGWNVVAKGTLGVAATVVLTQSTTVPDLLRGLDRLKMPKLLTAIAGFMVRYADVLRGESERMRIARISRGDNPRWIWQVKALASGSGALFVRSYERGERVHLAMQSRGFVGEMPDLDERRAGAADWRPTLGFPLAAAIVAIGSWVIR